MSKLLAGMNNTTYTENGAVTLKSTLNPLLDLFALGSAARGRDITKLFQDAYRHDRVNAIKCAFYMRDVRGGQGERDLFRQLLGWLYTNSHDDFRAIIPLVPFYGRWDDILEYTNDSVVVEFVAYQLQEDQKSKNPSLLAKWMPSEQSGKESRKLAMKWCTALHMTLREYRKMLSSLRQKLDIVERYMTSGEWGDIQYNKVPSRASMLYRKAFAKHDPNGYARYMEQVKSGEKKINAATLYPYEIYKKYQTIYNTDDTLEELWKALPNYITDNRSFIVVADTSGSMWGDPISVSVSLALYAAERSKGKFSNHFITFSGTPQLIRVTGNTVGEKFRNISHANWGMNTNLQAVFDLILNTAVRYKLDQSDLPDMIFIVSDMEFDSACGRYTNFEIIERKFTNAGYKRPTLVFWNVNARNNQVPVAEKENGVFLVSGLSAVTFKNALNTKATTPVEMMMDVLGSDRYARIEEVL